MSQKVIQQSDIGLKKSEIIETLKKIDEQK